MREAYIVRTINKTRKEEEEVKKEPEYNRSVYLYFIDLSKAFNCINAEVI